ncbi:MAG: hypothetical protein AUJ82_03895 [Verrucomicrobia bacterium CG1_02_43_26]|nr:MAG: hypothetical protein AUJ82_03895 [Verrucomicrobia bacterium CG1_02_43_26]
MHQNFIPSFLFILIFTKTTLMAGYPSDQPRPWVPIKIEDTSLSVQIAKTPQERAQGLMFRKSLASNHGMLFIFPSPQKVSFWMKNTSIPLDIAFFDADGILLEIHSLEPFNKTAMTSSSPQVLYALEVNEGFFSKNNIAPGAKLNLPPTITQK